MSTGKGKNDDKNHEFWFVQPEPATVDQSKIITPQINEAMDISKPA